MNHAETDKAVRAIVVTGTGKVFCAGEDLSELSEGGECQTVTEHGFGGLTARTCSKPVIAACNGSAAGGGMEIALSCDMVVASERAKFGCTEVGLGIIASTGGIVRLARDINRKDCMELLLTGKPIDALAPAFNSERFADQAKADKEDEKSESSSKAKSKSKKSKLNLQLLQPKQLQELH